MTERVPKKCPTQKGGKFSSYLKVVILAICKLNSKKKGGRNPILKRQNIFPK